MLDNARQILVSELVLAKSSDQDTISEEIEAALQ